MANVLCALGKEGLLDDTISLTVAVIKVVPVRGYTYNASHKFVSSVTGAGGTLHGTAQTLASKTYTNGVFDAADVTFTALAANANNHGLLVYQASAVTGGADVATSAQRIIAYLDTGTNLPFIPNGSDVVVQWSSLADKIFAL